MLVAPAHKLMQNKGDFVGMRCAPSNDALELEGIVCDGADFHQLGFDDLRVSHATLAWHIPALGQLCFHQEFRQRHEIAI